MQRVKAGRPNYYLTFVTSNGMSKADCLHGAGWTWTWPLAVQAESCQTVARLNVRLCRVQNVTAPSEPSSRCCLPTAAQKGALTQVATKPVFGYPEPPALRTYLQKNPPPPSFAQSKETSRRSRSSQSAGGTSGILNAPTFVSPWPQFNFISEDEAAAAAPPSSRWRGSESCGKRPSCPGRRRRQGGGGGG